MFSKMSQFINIYMRRKPMKEQEEHKLVVLHINLTGAVVALAAVVLILAAVSVYFILGVKPVSASDAPAAARAPEAISAASPTGLRGYYRSFTTYVTTDAVNACAAGYHFASLWEILDTSALRYASEIPDAWVYEADQGSGPPTGGEGLSRIAWVRTGYNGSNNGVPGQSNCNAWTSTSVDDYGTTVGLSIQWGSGTTEDVIIWDVGVSTCNYKTSVWCVED
jgi:hypothetical protein